jgi:hypothetical protein
MTEYKINGILEDCTRYFRTLLILLLQKKKMYNQQLITVGTAPQKWTNRNLSSAIVRAAARAQAPSAHRQPALRELLSFRVVPLLSPWG